MGNIGRHHLRVWGLMGVMSVTLLQACGGGASSSGGVSNNNLGGGFSLGEVAVLSMGSSNNATVTFSELSGGETFVFALGAANDNAGSFTYSVGSSSSLSADIVDLDDNIISAQVNQDINSQVAALAAQGQLDFTAVFHEHLRQKENQLAQTADPNETVEFSKNIQAVVSSCTAPTIGSTQSVKIFSSLSGSSTVTRSMTVRKVTDNAVFLVDSAVSSSSLSDSDLTTVATAFDEQAEEMIEIYGEWDHATECRIVVAISPVVNCLGASGGGWVTGYYYGGDQYTTSQYAASNERSIIYAAAPDPNGTSYCSNGVALSNSFWMSNIGPTVIPHEFQHLINFAQHVFFDNHSTEQMWFNEAMSHLAEDLEVSGSSHNFSNVGVENPSRVGLYLDSINSVAFSGGTSLTQRGGSYLFLRYLFEQAELGNISSVASGDALLSGLINNSNTGVNNITNTTGESFSDLLTNFCAAVYLDGTGLSTNPIYNFSGIDLRGTQDDNRGTELEGPAVNSYSGSSFSGSVASPSCLYLSMTGTQVSSMSGTVSITGDSSATGIGAVIRAN